MQETMHHPKAAKAVRILLALVLAIGLIPITGLMSGSTLAYADTPPVNDGNPFENGDFVWDDNTQTYRIADLKIRVGDIQQTGKTDHVGPFDYPKCLEKAYELLKQDPESGIGGAFSGWGNSDFDYGYVNVTENPREVQFSDLPTKGHCCQTHRSTTSSNERDARLILIEEKSYWSEDGLTYHACFAMLVDSDWEHGNYDQATMGTIYVYADWTIEATGTLELQKASSNSSISSNDAYSLEGAEYTVYSDEACTDEVGKLVTDSSGYAKLENVSEGWKWVKETKAPEGFWLDETVYKVYVDANATVRVNDTAVEDDPINDPAPLLVEKQDLEAGDEAGTPVGAAKLYNAEFTIRYYDGFYDTAEEAEASGDPTRTWVMRTDEDGYVNLRLGDSTFDVHDEEGNVVATYPYKVSGHPFYYQDGLIILPRGTVLIHESEAPEGYIKDPTVHVQQIKAPGDASIVTTYNAPKVPNQVKRGDLEFVKADETTQERLANIPFLITSRTTGESHVVVTDANGYFSTAANSHSENTNGNDAALGEHGAVDESKLDSAYGVWFGLDGDGNQLDADDALGALPYDTYDIEELPCTANEGLQLVTGTAIVTKDGYTVDLGTMDDPEAFIATRATDKADGDKYLAQDDEATVVDRVSYSNLIPEREYTLDAQLVDKASGKTLSEASVTFTPEKAAGYVNVELSASTLELAEHDLVVYETLSCDGRVLAEHKDLDDADQTVTVVPPEIGTSAVDGYDSDRTVVADTEATVVDTVSYSGLVPGKEYTVVGTLMDKATGEALTVDGSPVTASTTFTPDKSTGTVDVTFTFDASALEDGKELVAFESLTRLGKEVAVHADINDKGQTVKIKVPKISTVATDAVDGDKTVIADPEAVVTDTVSYTGLLAGMEYTLHGELMVKETDAEGAVSATPLLDTDGNPVVSAVTFTPDDSHGFIDMDFSCDASRFEEGTELVVFETLLRGDKEITSHKDAGDEGQTVTVSHPKIGTSAADAEDGDKVIIADPENVLTDTVTYTDLVRGKEYTVTGTLMDKATGEALLDAEGNPITASTTFVPEDTYGTVDVTFTFDGSALTEGTELVVFESLTRLGKEVAVHADLNDEGQTVVMNRPKIGTTAVDGLDGDKNVVADTEASVVDTVAYENLIPGKEYTVTGQVVIKTIDEEGNASSEALLDAEGNAVTASTTFTPEEPDGTVDVTFTFDGSNLAGKELVVFESLTRLDVELAVHADIEDEGQTVQVVPSEISTTAVDGLDGDKTVVADGQASIVDTVAYENLIPGGSYKAAGILMDKATGLPLLTGEGAADVTDEELRAFLEDVSVAAGFGYFTEDEHGARIYNSYLAPQDGTEPASFTPVLPDYEALAQLLADNADLVDRMVMASQEFTPEGPNGTVDVTYAFDASRWLQAEEAADTVVFELLLKDDLIVAVHADIEDEGQTAAIVPSRIATTATDKSDGDHKLLPTQDAVIVDTVEYTDLIPGKEYEVQGVLMDKSTGKPLMVNDKEVTSSVKFTPNEPNGSVELEFYFDSTGLLGKEIVVFETLYKDSVEVAVHADINDENQTVTVEEGPEGTTYDKTGDLLRQYGWVLGVIALAAAAAAAYGIRQRKLAKAEGSEPKQD